MIFTKYRIVVGGILVASVTILIGLAVSITTTIPPHMSTVNITKFLPNKTQMAAEKNMSDPCNSMSGSGILCLPNDTKLIQKYRGGSVI
ncbi:MAG: hypothetical protein DLM72_16655 [Candidatus Nitrosopolaris wilkensis]|nr:MAG: hypothetical protein DLM72_16655 [Candidatus Nitrosopolaris wilkensis]